MKHNTLGWFGCVVIRMTVKNVKTKHIGTEETTHKTKRGCVLESNTGDMVKRECENKESEILLLWQPLRQQLLRGDQASGRRKHR